MTQVELPNEPGIDANPTVSELSSCQSAAVDLQRFLQSNFWNESSAEPTENGLIGPDVGVRLNYRIGRFLKSMTSFYPWKDNIYYVQCQAYWALGNWRLLDLTGDDSYRQAAIDCMNCLIARQQPEGHWDYANREWKGRVLTVEGSWGALGLLETYRRTRDETYLDSALKWYNFFLKESGYQRWENNVAANYFARKDEIAVCNISAFTLPMLAEFTDLTGDESFMKECDGMIQFMEFAQLPSGEIPYYIPGEGDATESRVHFQCCQYNAFQCLDLMQYYDLTKDERVHAMIRRLLSFLSSCQLPDGHAAYQCGNASRQITYHAAVLAAALARAAEVGITGYEQQAELSFDYVMSLRNRDGSFPHSKKEYGILADKRRYPRNLSMIMFHLLHAVH